MDKHSYFTTKFLKPGTIKEENTMFFAVNNESAVKILLLANN